MPPKVRIIKDDIIGTAIEIIRKDGADSVNARAIAKELGCSTQPIFSNFATMDELKTAIIIRADSIYQNYINREIEKAEYPAYKSSGMAYIRFAKEEKELFKLLFMRDRSSENMENESEGTKKIAEIVKLSTGFEEDKARLFHLEMWAYVHGIASMTATNYLELDKELISKMMTDAYAGIKMRYESKE